MALRHYLFAGVLGLGAAFGTSCDIEYEAELELEESNKLLYGVVLEEVYSTSF